MRFFKRYKIRLLIINSFLLACSLPVAAKPLVSNCPTSAVLQQLAEHAVLTASS